MTPHYKIVEIGGEKLVIFYPQYKDDDGYKIIDPENRFPIELKNHTEYMSFLETLVEREQELKDGLTTLADLIEEMDMLSRGPKGDTRYMWVKYADDEQGNGMSDDPTGKKYIGFAFNKDTETPSDEPSDYKFVKYVADYEGLEIGGRNLLLNSQGEFMTNGSLTPVPFEGERLRQYLGEEITISFSAKKLDDNGSKIDAFLRSNAGAVSGAQSPIFSITDTWQRYFFTFTVTSEMVENTIQFAVRSNGYGGTDEFNAGFKEIKIEKGTVATDWSPAPEDIFDRIDNVDKAHVGLSNVQNYGIALESQAKVGVANNVYMTPLRTKQAIDANLEGAVFVVDSDIQGQRGYIKYSSGIMECWDRLEMERGANTRMDAIWRFPEEFSHEPNVSFVMDIRGKSTTPSTFEMAIQYIRELRTDCAELTIGRIQGGTDFAEGDVVYVYARAIGRWD